MSRKSILSLFPLGFLALSLSSGLALAATATASVAVTVTVQSSCQVSASATTPAIYTIAAANPTSFVAVSCDRPTAYNIVLAAGVAPDSPTMIQTTRPSSAVPLYPAHTITHSRVADTDTVAGISSAQPRSVDGQIAEPEQPAPAADADTVFVTITY